MPLQSEIYERFRCEKCGTNQMVYLGRDDDETAPYVEVIECGKCGWLECIEDIPWFQQKHGLVDEATDEPLPITQEMLREYGYKAKGEVKG